MRLKEDLLLKIEEQGGVGHPYDNNVIVDIEDFFEGNYVEESFAANACTENIDVREFYRIFKDIKLKSNVQDIKILIYSIEEDEDWPYSDTAFILTSASKKEVYDWFGDAFPSDIGEDDGKGKGLERLPKLKEGYKLYYLWWD